MADYSNPYAGATRRQAPFDDVLEAERRKKLQLLFEGGAQDPNAPLLAGANLGLKKSVFRGGTQAPQFDMSQHARALASAPEENQFAGLMKGLGSVAKATTGAPAETAAPVGTAAGRGIETSLEGIVPETAKAPVPAPGGLGAGAVDEAPEIFGPKGQILSPEERMQAQGVKIDEQMKASALGGPQVPPTPGSMAPQGTMMTEDEVAAEPAARAENPTTDEIAAPQGPNAKAGPTLTGSRKTLADIEAMTKAPAKQESKFWKRFGSGARQSLQAWAAAGQPGGAMGAFGAMLGGGGGAGASKEGHAEAKKKGAVNKLWKQYGQEMETEQAETKKNKAELDLLREQNKPLYESITADDVVTEAEAAESTAAGYPIKPYDKRAIDTQKRGGQTYGGYTKGEGAGVYQPLNSLPVERGEEDYEVTLPSGAKVPLKPGQAASTEVGIAQSKAGRVATATNQKATRTAAAATKRKEAKAKAAGAEETVKSLEAAKAKAVEEGAETTSIDTQIAKAKGDLAEAKKASLPDYDEALDYLIEKGYSEADAKAKLKGGQGKFYQ